MAQRILVTGAAGFIGSHTIDRLLSEGHAVFGVDNFRTGKESNLEWALRQKTFRFDRLDMTEESKFFLLCAEIRPTVIMHFAGLVSVPESIADPELNDRLNFYASRVVAEAARMYEISRVVFASSAAVYGDPSADPIAEEVRMRPLSPYGLAKLASEYLLLDYSRKYGIVVRCQRYFNVYGDRQDPSSPYSGVISRFLACSRRNERPMIFGDGEQTRDFVSVHDVATANVLAGTRAGLQSGAANVCTGIATSINKLWDLVSKLKNASLQPIYTAGRPAEIRYSCGATRRAYDEMEFIATTEIAAGLARMSRFGDGAITDGLEAIRPD